ncbi:MAG: DoxX family protein [Candidatus Nitronauta litoralis]|uniref:DoxX family protein n=1 Tax=Candidatus Nitronauta litoralis TaxID=2705533 RepID=A0A7T0G0H3_9BACT|nr:MAG: DoxX family protein [Candidatus Nitronauta litoralis]
MDYLKQFFKTEDSITPLVLRITLALVIFPHGAQKVLGWFGGFGFEGTLGFFTQKMGLPTGLVLLIFAGEFLGSLGLLTGFLTRFSAAGIAAIMTGAAATAHWGNGFFMNWSGKQAGEGFEFHILAIGIAVALIITGGGKFSVDQWISEKFLKFSKTPFVSRKLSLFTQ